jgi:membrane protein YqaA with SNARE-associated domain
MIFSFMRRLYDWVLAEAKSKRAERSLYSIAFIESIFFPIPPDVMLIPLCLASPKKAMRYAFFTLVASVMGGMMGYAIGYYFWQEIGQHILNIYGYGDGLDSIKSAFNQYGWLIVLGGGITPIPYKVITIASGIVAFSLWPFIMASIIGRGVRFFALALLLYIFGEKIRLFIEKYFSILSILFFVLLVGGILLLGAL